jgi:outer membrane protein TolC
MRGLVSLVLALALGSAREGAGATLGFRQALRIAAERSPAVRAAQRGGLGFERARLASDPLVLLPAQLQLTAGARRFPSGAPSGLDANAQLVQPVPLRPLGATRARVLEAARDLAAERAEEARLLVAERAAHAWIDASFAERSLELRQRARDEAKGLTRLARVRVASGLASAGEVALANADEALADGEVLDAEGRVTESRLTLGALLGEETVDLALDGSDAPGEVALPSYEVARASMRSKHPALRRARAYGEHLGREADYVHAQFGTSLGIGLVASREGQGELVGGALVSIPLALSTPGQADALRARAEADEAELFREVEEVELVRQLRVAIHEHTHTREVLASALKAVAALQEAYRLARAQVDRGASDFALAALARQRLIAGEDRALHARAEVFHANVRLLALQGSLLEGSKP